MSIKVAINGFGRIGRLALRQIIKTEGLEVVAVNDLTPADMLLHLFKYDTTQGRFQGTAELKDNAIVVDGKEIKVFADADPEALPWGELGVDVVLECTGFFTTKEKAEKHIKAGARKVVISAPGGDMKTVVFGVNQDILDGSETVISAASCTTNCLAPMAKALNAGLRRALEADPKVLLAGEDIGKLGGVFRITEHLQRDFGADRVIDSPLAESGIVGTSLGLALRGY
nr:glyceraldehyde 3-phosphate dehydrogenase NAD-binding domain-containing protein [Neisseria sp.]